MGNVASVFLVETIKSMKGLKSNAEGAMAQVSDEELFFQPDEESNSIEIIIRHLSGNMISRFTDFLTTDGEKEWRNRDQEFVGRKISRTELMKIWEQGWECLFNCLTSLTEDDLLKIVLIRGEEHTVVRALLRQLAHYAYHAGQIVYLCKHIRSSEFKSLSIPKKKQDD